MSNNALITVDESTLAAFNSIDAVYAHIATQLSKYEGLGALTFTWEKGKTLSKTVSEAQDGAGIPKAQRAEQFRKVRAIMINEGLNDLLEAMFRKLGGKGSFQGVGKNGVANFKFIPPVLANNKVDAVIKAANALETETQNKRMKQSANAQGFDVLPDGSFVRRLTDKTE